MTEHRKKGRQTKKEYENIWKNRSIIVPIKIKIRT